MRGLVALVLWLIASSAFSQFEYADKPTLGQAIGIGAQAATDEPKIVMETIENCDACKRWLRSDGIDLLEAGWVLQVKKVPADAGLKYPRWKVCLRSGCGVIENTRDFKSALQRWIDARRK